MKKLNDYQSQLKSRINSWDLMSIGLGLAGGAALVISFCQPKHPLNGLRLFASFGCFTASVLAERARESDLFDFDKAVSLKDAIVRDHIKFESVASATAKEFAIADAAFAAVPVDRHEELARRLGIAPPNLKARQPDTFLDEIQAAPVGIQAAPVGIQTPNINQPLPDPSADFDPEEEESDDKDSGASFIPAARVVDWFESMGDAIPEALIKEWGESKGRGIEITDGTAKIVGANND